MRRVVGGQAADEFVVGELAERAAVALQEPREAHGQPVRAGFDVKDSLALANERDRHRVGEDAVAW